MSSDGDTTVLCGGLGRILGWVLIWLREHEFVNVGVRINTRKLVAKGWTPLEAHFFKEMIERDIRKWYELAERRGVDYDESPPYPGNITSPVVPEPYPIPPPP